MHAKGCLLPLRPRVWYQFFPFIPQRVMAKLTFVLEGQEVVVPLVDAVTLSLGRGDDNDVVVDDDRVSTHHAALERNADGRIEVRDLNSTAGTFVNGERVQSRCIAHGDTLAFGPLTALFDLEELNGHTNGNGHGNGSGNGAHLVKEALLRPAPSRKKGKSPKQSPRTPPAEDQAARDRDKAAHVEAMAQLAAEKTRLQVEVEAEQNALHEWQQRAAEELREHTAEKKRLQTEAAAAQAELQTWKGHAAREMRDHNVRLDTLRADERRLAHVTAAVQEAQALQQQWAEAVKTLSAEYEQINVEVQRLTSTEAATRHEVEALGTHKDQALAHLNQLREECGHEEAHLVTLRQELPALEEHSKRTKELADAREDQVKLAEKKLEQIADQRTRLEAHIKELTGTEEKLVQAQTRLNEVETAHATLTTTLATLGGEKLRLEGTVKELQQATLTLEKTRTDQKQTEQALQTQQAELKAIQASLATTTRQLEEATTRRSEIARQCAELADTEEKLVAATKQHTGLKSIITETEATVASLKESVDELQGRESAAKGRLEVLHGREQDLRSELTKLAASEHSSRDRFEEFQQLMSEAEKEHAAQQEEHAQKIKTAKHELLEIESKLTPLRDWKEAMDLLYARLGDLPEGSEEARDLWREIEKEKSDLKALIANARSFMPQKAGAARVSTAQTAPVPTPQPVPVMVEAPLEVDYHVSAAGLAQEQTLKSRLTYLRENVQREENRLEFLRQQRGRIEVRARVGNGTGGAAGEAMRREHDRHLEAKIRHDEEHLRSLNHTLELAKAEEEKRRAKIADMERKMAELHAGITEAERHRSDLRHQADLAHTEVKNFEATLERLKRMAEIEAAKVSD